MHQKKFILQLLSGITAFLILLVVIFLSAYKKPAKNKDENIHYVKNPKGGPVLGYAESSSVKVIEQDGYFFERP